MDTMPVKPYLCKYDWPIKKRPNDTARIPYAYVESPDDKRTLVPNMELVPFIERALDHISDGNSVRSVAQWLSKASAKDISHQGLEYIWQLKCANDPNNPRARKRRVAKRKRVGRTPEEKEAFKLKRQIQKAKYRATVDTKKLTAVEAAIEAKRNEVIQEPEEIYYPPFNPDEVVVLPDEFVHRELGFSPNPGPQTDFLASDERETLFGGQAGGGKVGARDSLILTPFGFKKWEDLKVGDLINHPNGAVQKVVQLHPWVKIPQWIVEFSDGTKLRVAEEHLWQAWKSRKGRKINNIRTFGEASAEVVETRTLKEWVDKGYNPQIPVCMPQAFNTVSRIADEIEPYFLGLLLGDGCITTSTISLACANEDWEFYKTELNMEHTAYGQQIRFIGEGRAKTVEQLRKHGLIGTCSNSKFIPAKFKTSPLPTRYALIQGLMDTDGYNDPKDNGCYYYSVSKQLADDVAWILRSLGCVVTITTKIGKYRNDEGVIVDCQLCYCLYIKTRQADLLFRLPRKKINKQDIDISKRVTAVYEQGTIDGRCITVSHPNGLYVTDDFIVTHNSFALLADPMRYFDNPNFRGIIMRRTNDELKELKWKSQELYGKLFPGAKWREKDSMWVFPSGAQYWFTYLDRDDDVTRYQGQTFTYIAFDELTQYATPFAWNYMRSRLRSTDPTLPLYMRATTNPGNVGHGWVKRMFIDPAPYNTPFPATDIDTNEVLKYPDNHHNKKLRGQPLFYRRFIPSKLADNPYLMKDGQYEANLLSLPEHLRRQLLDGDWNVSEGAAFPEFRVSSHVIEPFKIPKGWRRFRSCDYGYSSFAAVHWFAIDPVYETLVVYRELYESKLTGRDLAAKILKIERDADEVMGYGVLDSSVWHQRGFVGPSIAEEMITMGVRWRPSDRTKGARTAGKNRLHELLKIDTFDDGKQVPGIVFFNTCRQIIADLQVIPVHPDGVDDIDDRYPSDHTYDSIRYGVMSRPRGATPWDLEGTRIQTSYKPADPVFGY